MIILVVSSSTRTNLISCRVSSAVTRTSASTTLGSYQPLRERIFSTVSQGIVIPRVERVVVERDFENPCSERERAARIAPTHPDWTRRIGSPDGAMISATSSSRGMFAIRALPI